MIAIVTDGAPAGKKEEIIFNTLFPSGEKGVYHRIMSLSEREYVVGNSCAEFSVVLMEEQIKISNFLCAHALNWCLFVEYLEENKVRYENLVYNGIR